MIPYGLPKPSVTATDSTSREVSVPSPFLDALPLSLRKQLEEIIASPALNLQRSVLSSSHRATPTEEESCSCATCGSTCCDLV